MKPTRFLRASVVASAVLIGACGDAAREPEPETALAAAPPPAAEPPSWTGSWASEMGGILLVPSDTDNSAILVYPDVPADSPPTARVTLLTSGGEIAATNVVVQGMDSLECGGAPVLRLSEGAFGTWAVGLDTVRVLRGDSVEALAAGDSARLVANLARLASTITAHEETRFNGLPFSVARARRYTAGNTRIVAAHLVRRLPQEASPLEEHTFLIAERPLASDSLVLRFSQRSEGSEETAQHFEVLAAVPAGSSLLLLLSRDNVSGTTYEILERTASGWRVRWTRPLRC